MKRLGALIMMALFVISMVPAAFAQDTADTQVTDQETIQAVAISAPLEAGDRPRPDADNAQLLRDRLRDHCKDAPDQEACMRKARARLTDQGPAMNSETRDERIADVRARTQEKLEHALERCENAAEPARCKEAIQKRIDALANADEGSLRRAAVLDRRLVNRANELDEMRQKRSFEQFKGKMLHAREIAKEKVQNAERRYKEAKDRYKDAREKYQDARERWNANKDRVQACKEDDSEECVAARAEARSSAIDQLDRALDAVINQIEKLKSRVEGADSLSEEQAAEMLSSLDTKLAEAQALKEKVAALGDDASKDEISALATETRALLKSLDRGVKKTAGKTVNAKIGNIILRSKQMATRLDHALVKLAEQGKDTSGVEGLVDEFHTSLADAETSYESAREKFAADDVKGAHKDVRAAHAKLKEAHTTLKEIVKSIRDLGGQDELSESLEDDSAEAEADAAEELDNSDEDND